MEKASEREKFPTAENYVAIYNFPRAPGSSWRGIVFPFWQTIMRLRAKLFKSWAGTRKSSWRKQKSKSKIPP